MAFYTAKDPVNFEALTVSSSAVGPTLAKLTSTTDPYEANYALFRVETNDVRWRDDGTAPTAAVGTLLKAGETMIYDADPRALLFIRTTADASVTCAYYRVG